MNVTKLDGPPPNCTSLRSRNAVCIPRSMVMSRILAACLLTIVSGTSLAQMMGGQMSTANYFPMVDGSRYDYMYSGGPWATATAVMHSGQTWAGVSGLTAMHTTYVCNQGTTCAPDATDFFRMDPDGMHYFGGTGSDPTGTHFSMMSYTNPEWLISNPVTPGIMMGGTGGGYQNAGMWSTTVMGTGSMMGGQSFMSSYQAQALETVTTPAGTFANALHVREQRGSGYTRDVWYAPGVGMVKMDDGTNVALLSGYTIPGSGATATSITPADGLWIIDAEAGASGRGLQIEQHGGSLVLMYYGYSAGGGGLWTLSAGAMTGNGFSATMDTYRGGATMGGSYNPATPAGSVGRVSINFTSATTGTINFPGESPKAISKFMW